MRKEDVISGNAKIAELSELQKGILKVLSDWNKPNGSCFDAMWYGYEALQDELDEICIVEPMSEIKKAMKKLKEWDIVEREHTYDNDFRISGSGYFLVGRHDANFTIEPNHNVSPVTPTKQ